MLKLENTQLTGSFKIRGIGNLCQREKNDGISHFITSSGGNAGFAVAYAGRKLGIKTIVFVPKTTPNDTILKIEDQGADVIVDGYVWDETDEIALDFAKKLLLQEKVAVVPGSAFGKEFDSYIRISYATSLDNLKDAVVRIEKFLSKMS